MDLGKGLRGMNWLELVNAVKWQVFTVAVLIVFYKPLSHGLVELIRRIRDITLERKRLRIGASFAPDAKTPPRPKRLDSLIEMIRTTGANVDKLAIECLLQEYVSNSDFWPEKLAIGDFMVKYHLPRAKVVILDTGTTVAAVATQMMARADWPDIVITNSVTTAAFISVTKAIHTRSLPQVYMPPGIVHSEYRGSYLLRSDLAEMPETKYNSVVRAIQTIPKYLVKGQGTVYGIVAATYFSAKYGPGANSQWNREWKRDTFELADSIVVCVDISKIGQFTNGIFSEDEWVNKLEDKEVKILVAGIPDDSQRSYVMDEFKTFRGVEEKLNKTLLYQGEIKGGCWEFVSRDECRRLAWGSQGAGGVESEAGE